FYILEQDWPSAIYKNFMRAIDAMAANDADSKSAVGARAPPGLWRNCYDSKWLRTLKDHERRALRIVDEDYDFSIDPEEHD
ncbi:hypothetical protein C8Q78DRAFT_952174, partial [Trametes maxima]